MTTSSNPPPHPVNRWTILAELDRRGWGARPVSIGAALAYRCPNDGTIHDRIRIALGWLRRNGLVTVTGDHPVVQDGRVTDTGNRVCRITAKGHRALAKRARETPPDLNRLAVKVVFGDADREGP